MARIPRTFKRLCFYGALLVGFVIISYLCAHYIPRNSAKVTKWIPYSINGLEFLDTFAGVVDSKTRKNTGNTGSMSYNIEEIIRLSATPWDMTTPNTWALTSPAQPVSEEDRIFQSVDGREAWIYSAFYDYVAAKSGNHFVRVLAVFDRRLRRGVHCFLQTEKGNTTSKGWTNFYPDFHRRRYLPSFIDCRIRKDERPTHISVSFSNDSTRKRTNLLPVLYPGHRSRNFTVCYSVLHSNFSHASQIIEAIEINRVLGADHFVLYNMSMSPQVDHIISRYQSEGLLTVYQWPLPTTGSWYYAQVTAINDCMFRNRNISQFVVVQDTDEIIVPQQNKTWMDLIESSTEQHFQQYNTTTKHTLGAFVVRSSYFGTRKDKVWNSTLPSNVSFTPEEEKFVTQCGMNFLSSFWHARTIFHHKVRTKYIMRPESVWSAGVHFPRGLAKGAKLIPVTEDMALVHHLKGRDRKLVMNTGLLKYKAQVIPRLLDRVHQFPDLCPKANFSIMPSH